MRVYVFIIVFALILSGCALISRKGDLVGYYEMTAGGFNESMTVELRSDATYVLKHELVLCSIGEDGGLPLFVSQEEGLWRFDGDVVLLDAKTQTEGFPSEPVFAPALAHRLRRENDAHHVLLVSADYPRNLVLRKTSRPNQTLEPTAPTVTSRAGARLAPAGAVAHLGR